jgi:hypothetical protein
MISILGRMSAARVGRGKVEVRLVGFTDLLGLGEGGGGLDNGVIGFVLRG